MKTPLLALKNDFGCILVFLPQEIQELCYTFLLVLIQVHIFLLFVPYKV